MKLSSGASSILQPKLQVCRDEDSCAAPWRAHSNHAAASGQGAARRARRAGRNAGLTLQERDKWLRAAADKGHAGLSSVLERLERAKARHELTAADYNWLPSR
jgi:hypothetical protein